MVRREEVQVERQRPRLRNGHDTVRGQQVDRPVFLDCVRQQWEINVQMVAVI